MPSLPLCDSPTRVGNEVRDDTNAVSIPGGGAGLRLASWQQFRLRRRLARDPEASTTGFPPSSRRPPPPASGLRGLAALNGITPDPAVVSRDRGQGVFRQSFEQFSSRMVNSYRLSRGASLIRQYADTFNRIERQFGVSGAGPRRHLGAGDGFRRGKRQFSDDPFARDARL